MFVFYSAFLQLSHIEDLKLRLSATYRRAAKATFCTISCSLHWHHSDISYNWSCISCKFCCSNPCFTSFWTFHGSSRTSQLCKLSYSVTCPTAPSCVFMAHTLNSLGSPLGQKKALCSIWSFRKTRRKSWKTSWKIPSKSTTFYTLQILTL